MDTLINRILFSRTASVNLEARSSEMVMPDNADMLGSSLACACSKFDTLYGCQPGAQRSALLLPCRRHRVLHTCRTKRTRFEVEDIFCYVSYLLSSSPNDIRATCPAQPHTCYQTSLHHLFLSRPAVLPAPPHHFHPRNLH